MIARLFSGSGSSVWVCDPQGVGIDATCTGAVMSLMSNTRIPSNIPGVEAVTPVLLQAPLLCGESTDWNRRLPMTDTSLCGPLQAKSVTTCGASGSDTSRIRNP